MEIGLETYPGHADGVNDPLLVVHRVFLGDDVQDFVAWGQNQLEHITDELVNIVLADLQMIVMADQHTAML